MHRQSELIVKGPVRSLSHIGRVKLPSVQLLRNEVSASYETNYIPFFQERMISNLSTIATDRTRTFPSYARCSLKRKKKLAESTRSAYGQLRYSPQEMLCAKKLGGAPIYVRPFYRVDLTIETTRIYARDG